MWFVFHFFGWGEGIENHWFLVWFFVIFCFFVYRNISEIIFRFGYFFFF